MSRYWHETQLSEENAIKLADSKQLENLTDREIVDFQLFQKRLCMDFLRFQQAIENMIGHSITTIAFTFHKGMVDGYLGDREPPKTDVMRVFLKLTGA